MQRPAKPRTPVQFRPRPPDPIAPCAPEITRHVRVFCCALNMHLATDASVGAFQARVAKLVYAKDLKSFGRKAMRVRPPPRAPQRTSPSSAAALRRSGFSRELFLAATDDPARKPTRAPTRETQRRHCNRAAAAQTHAHPFLSSRAQRGICLPATTDRADYRYVRLRLKGRYAWHHPKTSTEGSIQETRSAGCAAPASSSPSIR